MACAQWSINMTSKGLHYVQILENSVLKSVLSGLVLIKHIGSDLNLSDIFTNEERVVAYFVVITNVLPPSHPHPFR